MSVLCHTAGVSRASFYRWRSPRAADVAQMDLRHELQKLALQSPAYGYRRLTAELQRRGFAINTNVCCD